MRPYTPRPVARKSTKAGRSTPAASDEASDAPERGVDEILTSLERVVEELEEGDLPLERALSRFEEGVRLAREGGAMLAAVEEKVEVLLADRDEIVPFEDRADDEDDDDES